MPDFLAAFYLHDLSPFLWEFAPGIGLRWYGLAYVVAFLAGWLVYRHLARSGWADLPVAQVGDFITWWVVLGTLLGGRLGYVLFYQPRLLLEDPLGIVRVWEGGMSAHGGMLGLILATLFYARKYHLNWCNLGDNLVVAAPIGLFCGRLANFINGELYGRVTTVPWAMQFPQELYREPGLVVRLWQEFPQWRGLPVAEIIEAARSSPALQEALRQLLQPRHPSQLYEAALEGALLFVLLWWLRTRMMVPNGVLTGVFFLAYAVFRFSVEFYREPDAALIGPLTRGQFLSLGLVLIGLAFLIYAYRYPSYPRAKDPTARTPGQKQAGTGEEATERPPPAGLSPKRGRKSAPGDAHYQRPPP